MEKIMKAVILLPPQPLIPHHQKEKKLRKRKARVVNLSAAKFKK